FGYAKGVDNGLMTFSTTMLAHHLLGTYKYFNYDTLLASMFGISFGISIVKLNGIHPFLITFSTGMISYHLYRIFRFCKKNYSEYVEDMQELANRNNNNENS